MQNNKGIDQASYLKLLTNLSTTLNVNSHKLVSLYFFKVDNRTTRKRCERCSKLTLKTPERRY